MRIIKHQSYTVGGGILWDIQAGPPWRVIKTFEELKEAKIYLMNNNNNMMPKEWPSKMVEYEIYCNADFMIELLNDNGREQLWEAISDSNDDEVMEWWLVSDWLAGQLDAIDEYVADLNGQKVWGRTCCGQAIAMDSFWESIWKRVQR